MLCLPEIAFFQRKCYTFEEIQQTKAIVRQHCCTCSGFCLCSKFRYIGKKASYFRRNNICIYASG